MFMAISPVTSSTVVPSYRYTGQTPAVISSG
nr:MAG TPA: hypothetical protein [Caudoviricetes sp.]